MRIIEPRPSLNKRYKSRPFQKYIIVFIIVGFGVLSWLAWQHPPKIKQSKKPPPPAVESAQVYQNNVTDTARPLVIKNFADDDFKKVFYSLAHPNTQLFSTPPSITNNVEADMRIRQLASLRGYKLTSVPIMSIDYVGETPGEELLQPLAYESWLKLKKTAEAEDIPLIILSGYRSPESQRDLFMSRLLARGINIDDIASGRVDVAVKETLAITAVPGFSRHHTGYTVDFGCLDGSATFGSSKCFKWLNQNNYMRAKQHGWIPSYPGEAGLQGPEPEPWEYVWVGIDAISSQ